METATGQRLAGSRPGGGCFHVIVMGVSGSGKTTVAEALARELDVEVIEGDEYHPPANVEKMGAGIPLSDEDRRPWLETLAGLIRDRHERGRGTVLACSALKRAYRDTLRAAVPTEETFVVALDADTDTLRERMKARKGHFMPASLLESQLATLEHLGDDERGVTIDAGRPAEVVIADAIRSVRSFIRP
jgi:gluconokinase